MRVIRCFDYDDKLLVEKFQLTDFVQDTAVVFLTLESPNLLVLVQVHVEFSDGGDVIKIEGPPDETEKAREALENQAKELIRTMDYAVISVDAKYHKHIIGKGGSTGELPLLLPPSTQPFCTIGPF